jgi:hypothetical protein
LARSTSSVSVPTEYPGTRENRACWPGPGLYTETDSDQALGHSYVYAFRPGTTNLDAVWLSNDEALGTAVVRVDAGTIYLSSYAAGKTHLKAVRISDGGSAWPADALFDSSVLIGFTFDASGNLFNNTDFNLETSTVSRVDTATGAIAWTYRPPAGQFADVRVDGPADFALALEGPELIAIDKQDGHQRWRVNVDPDAQYATWYPTVLASGDVLITGELTQIGGPDDARARTVGEHLQDRIVVRGAPTHRSPRQSAALIVDRDDQLAHHHPVAERDNAGVALELGIHDDPWNQAPVQGTDVARRVPDGFGARVDMDLLVQCGHDPPARNLSIHVRFSMRGSAKDVFGHGGVFERVGQVGISHSRGDEVDPVVAGPAVDELVGYVRLDVAERANVHAVPAALADSPAGFRDLELYLVVGR